jgi:hypothetical protein
MKRRSSSWASPGRHLPGGLRREAADQTRRASSTTPPLPGHQHQGERRYGVHRAGWKVGDKTSWEQQLKTRVQGQNEYNKGSLNGEAMAVR